MNKQLRQCLAHSAKSAFCLVCGFGRACSCHSYQRVEPASRTFHRHVDGDKGRFFLCPDCEAVSQFPHGLTLYSCDCGRVFEHNFKPSKLPDRDYSELLNVDQLPTKATRKPKVLRCFK